MQTCTCIWTTGWQVERLTQKYHHALLHPKATYVKMRIQCTRVQVVSRRRVDSMNVAPICRVHLRVY